MRSSPSSWRSPTSASRARGNAKYDVPGAIVASFGLFCLVLGVSRSATDGWNGMSTMTFLAISVVMLLVFLFISYFFQAVMRYSALTSGLLLLPFSAGIVISAGIASRLLPRFGPRWVAFTGFILAIVGMALYLRLTAETMYVSGILPSIIIMSLGIMIVAAIVWVTLVRTSHDDMAANDAVPAAGR